MRNFPIGTVFDISPNEMYWIAYAGFSRTFDYFDNIPYYAILLEVTYQDGSQYDEEPFYEMVVFWRGGLVECWVNGNLIMPNVFRSDFLNSLLADIKRE